jgi:hypothetical protein
VRSIYAPHLSLAAVGGSAAAGTGEKLVSLSISVLQLSPLPR